MKKFLKKITSWLDLLILCLIILFTTLYCSKIEIIFLSKIIIIITLITLVTKMFYWFSNTKFLDKNDIKNNTNLFFLRIAVCIFLYITPAYYFIQYPNLVVSEYIISFTLIIVSFLALLAKAIEKYSIFLKTNN